MSGTDYTLTPNYGLYKPVPNADGSMWGAHLNANADTLDSLLTAIGVNVKNFGAKGDGVTDDTVAINAALNYIRATSQPAPHWTLKLTFPQGRYVVTGPLNFTGLFNSGEMIVDGCGSELWLKSATAVLDCLTSRWVLFKEMTIYGDPTTPPHIGMQIGRAAGPSSDYITLFNVKFWGVFGFTPFYNFASEMLTCYTCTFNNDNTAANTFCMVDDGINHWGVTSTFVTVSAPADTYQSNNGTTFYVCTFQGLGATGNVWLASANYHAFQRCYASNGGGSPFILYQAAGGQPLANFLEIDCHVETTALLHMVQFTGPVGITYALVIGLLVKDFSCQASVSALSIDSASALTGVEIREARLLIGGPCPLLFDAPAKYAVRAVETLLGDGMWVQPGYWAGPVGNATAPGTVPVPENASVAATNGGNYTCFRNAQWIELSPAATIATFTVTLPASPVHSQTVLISTTQTITTLTLTPNTGQTVTVQPGTLTANTSVSYRCDMTTGTWLCLGHTT